MEITKDKFNILIGRRIMDIRQKKHYTREQLAEYVDISPKYLYEIEAGRKTCSLFIGYKLSKYLDVDMNYLLREKISIKEKSNIESIYQQLQCGQQEQISKIVQMIYEMIKSAQ